MGITYVVSRSRNGNQPSDIVTENNPEFNPGERFYIWTIMTNFEGDFRITWTAKINGGNDIIVTHDVGPSSWTWYNAYAWFEINKSGNHSVDIESSRFGGFTIPFRIKEISQTPVPDEEPDEEPDEKEEVSELPPGTVVVDCDDPTAIGTLPDGTCFALEDELFTPIPPDLLIVTEILAKVFELQFEIFTPVRKIIDEIKEITNFTEEQIITSLAIGGLVGGSVFIGGGGSAAVGAIARARGIGTTLAGIDVLTVWLASDNIITGLTFTAKSIKESVKSGIINLEQGLVLWERANVWMKSSIEFVEKSVKFNPTLIPFKGPFLINTEKGRLDLDMERELIIQADTERREKEEKKKK